MNIFVNEFGKEKENELNFFLLDIWSRLFYFDEVFDQNEWPTNCFKNFFIKKGAIKLLENMQYSHDKKISKLSEVMISKHFDCL